MGVRKKGAGGGLQISGKVSYLLELYNFIVHLSIREITAGGICQVRTGYKGYLDIPKKEGCLKTSCPPPAGTKIQQGLRDHGCRGGEGGGNGILRGKD